MKNFFKLVAIRFGYFCKNWVILICLFISIIASLLYGIISSEETPLEDIFEIAVINEDSGDLSPIIVDKVETLENVHTRYIDLQKATLQLSLGRIDGIFIIHDDFSRRLERGEYKGIMTMISPITLSSSAPIGDFISTQVMYIWLRELTADKLQKFYQESEREG